MGEEEKKKPDEAKMENEEKKVAQPPKKPDVQKPVAAVAAEEKKEEKKSEAEQPPPPPPPPQEIILKVYMHCEGCARKVRRCLNGFEGVEDVITDCRTSKVIVKGEKADPLKVLERVQKKSHRQVILISPVPVPAEPKKVEEEKVVIIEEKKEEPPVITLVLGVYMHCEACAQEIKKRIMKMKGVESAEPDLKSSQVTVKGVIEPEKLIDYVHKRTGKHAVLIKAETEKKVEEEKGKEEKKEGKKTEEGDASAEEAGNKGKETGGGGEPQAKPEAEKAATEESTTLDLKKNEFYYYHPQNYHVYPQRFVQDIHSYPPQMFSDENPNACSVM